MIELLWGEKMTETKKITIAITATFTAELIEEPLAYWMKELEIQSRIEFSPYSQVFQQLLDPLSLFSKNDKGINIVLVRLEDWWRYKDSSTAGVNFSSNEYEEIEEKIGYKIYKNYPEKFTITFICSGNLCRSPMAAGILKNIIIRTKYKKMVNINSAGTLKMDLMPAEPNAIETGTRHR